MTEHVKSRKGRSGTTAERIVTAGLATATCIGVVGLLGTRMVSAQEVSAQEMTADSAAQGSTPVLLADPAATVTTSSSGMTRSDLDAYAALLAAEKDRLDAYRADLKAAARAINAAGQSQGASGDWSQPGSRGATRNPGTTVPAIPAPAPKPAPAAAAPPVLAAPAPQAVSKGS